jgi:ammonium transporter, Amt family
VWGGGWLAKLGVMDFAGGIVVHVNAGVAALVCALVIGRRRGFPHVAMPPHSLPVAVAGAGMLWVGWFGFNGGSALAANGAAAMAVLCTHVGAAAGALAWMLVEWRRYGKPSALGVITGMVAGLGTITPASGFVGVGGALAIGFSAGIVCFFATQLLKRVLHLDDSLDVSPVHGVGGIIGTLLTGVFAAVSLGGSGFTVQKDMMSQIGVQAVGIGATILWCGVVTWVLLKLLDVTLGLRVSEEQESEGLDLAEHGEKSYNH